VIRLVLTLLACDSRPGRPVLVSCFVICPCGWAGAGLTPFVGLIRSLSALA